MPTPPALDMVKAFLIWHLGLPGRVDDHESNATRGFRLRAPSHGQHLASRVDDDGGDATCGYGGGLGLRAPCFENEHSLALPRHQRRRRLRTVQGCLRVVEGEASKPVEESGGARGEERLRLWVEPRRGGVVPSIRLLDLIGPRTTLRRYLRT